MHVLVMLSVHPQRPQVYGAQPLFATYARFVQGLCGVAVLRCKPYQNTAPVTT